MLVENERDRTRLQSGMIGLLEDIESVESKTAEFCDGCHAIGVNFDVVRVRRRR